MRMGTRSIAGKAWLETDNLLFRQQGKDAAEPRRLKILFRDLSGVRAAGGVLTLEFAGGPAEFELGRAAEKWAQKILHPPTRADKLGLKTGLVARVTGEVEAGFLEELTQRGVTTAGGRSPVDLIFFGARKTADLDKLGKLSGGLKSDGALWVIYPKGVPEIREIEVLEAGRAAGLKDNKVASFSASHTALKFVIPVSKR